MLTYLKTLNTKSNSLTLDLSEEEELGDH